MIDEKEVITIDGCIGFDECLNEILHIAKLIHENSEQSWVNTVRIRSIRSVIGLFEDYNNQITGEGKSN